MSEILVPVVFVGMSLTLLFGFQALDNWHKRKAWRDAERGAREYMRQFYGVEKGPDGKWRKVS